MLYKVTENIDMPEFHKNLTTTMTFYVENKQLVQQKMN